MLGPVTSELLLNIFAGAILTWRLTIMLVYEDGPFDIFVHLRDWAGVRYDEHSEAYGIYFLGKLLACYKCTSVWVGWLVAFLAYGVITLQTILFGLLLSGLTVLIQKVVK